MEETSNRINIISFTKKGEALAKRLSTYLLQSQNGLAKKNEKIVNDIVEKIVDESKCIWVRCINKCRASEEYSSIRLSECAKESFEKRQGMIFIGAAGIAVRTIAPFLKDKLHDPFVIVIDENGDYVIPILSGHVGRANEYARMIAAFLDAQAVITTATDVSHCFAVDLFAQKNQYVIQNKEGIARVSSKTLAHEAITVHTMGEIVTLSFDGTVVKREPLQKNQEATSNSMKMIVAQTDFAASDSVFSDIIISPFIQDRKKGTLWLVPRCIVVGVGCRRGKETTFIEQAICERLSACGIAKEAVGLITSIDRKKDEKGLIETAAQFHVEFATFSEETLKQVPGTFSSSAFVEKTVGVDNVCERSAMAAAPQGTLLANKYAKDGVTVAIAMRAFSPLF